MSKHGKSRKAAEGNEVKDTEKYVTWGYVVPILTGVCLGGLICVAGFILVMLGLTGSIEWIVEAKAFKSRLANASPGVFFALLGAFVLWKYKPVMKERRLRKVIRESDGTTSTKSTTKQTEPQKITFEISLHERKLASGHTIELQDALKPSSPFNVTGIWVSNQNQNKERETEK